MGEVPVGRQYQSVPSSIAPRTPGDFVRGEIVGDHGPRESAWAHLFDIKETRPVDGAVEDPGRGRPV